MAPVLSPAIRSGSWPAATIVACPLSASMPKRRKPTNSAKREADKPNPDEPTSLPFTSANDLTPGPPTIR